MFNLIFALKEGMIIKMNNCCRSAMLNNNILNSNTSCYNNSLLNSTCNNQNVLGTQDSCTNENLLDSLCSCVRQKMFL